MKEGNRLAASPCPLSKHCLRFVDQLDALLPFTFPSMENVQDERLLDQLREHIPTCPTCTAALTQARRLRTWQRSVLWDALAESEQKVPSTTVHILSAIAGEPPDGPPSRQSHGMNDSTQGMLVHTQTKQPPAIPEKRQPNVIWRNIFSMTAVAAILLMAITLFSFLSQMRASLGSPVHQLSYTNGWSAAVIGQVEHGQVSIVNYDPSRGKSVQLVKPLTADNTTIDGVSHDGHNLLYHYSSSGHTYYTTLVPLPKTGFLYELNDEDAGDALWMTDSRHVLIATNQGIIEADSQTGASNLVAPSLSAGHLWFYRDGYLYYDYTKNHIGFDLWRINIASGDVERVTTTFRGHSYFLSPDGTTIFYVDNVGKSALSETAIYTIKVNAAGAHARLLLKIDATPIGFAADNALELLQRVNGRFQVVKLKPAQPTIDRVILDDAAPGAIALCDRTEMSFGPVCSENVALSPYGHGLVVIGLYADGGRKIWADDLITGKQQVLQTLDSNAPHVQLPGWDRIAVG